MRSFIELFKTLSGKRTRRVCCRGTGRTPGVARDCGYCGGSGRQPA